MNEFKKFSRKNKTLEELFGSEKATLWRKHMSETKLGKHNSEKHNKNIQKALMGHSVTKKTREKLRKFNLGRTPWNKGKTGIYSEETKQKIKMANVGKHHTEESKKKMQGRTPWNKGKTGVYVLSEITKEKLRIANTGKKRSEETLKKMRGRTPWNKGKKGLYKHSKESIEKLLRNRKYDIPNGYELYLDFLLQNYFPDEWKFVGDGNCVINGLCPDFINVNGEKKIIEIFGSYWHKNTDRYNRTEEGRKKIYSNLGYDTLILWDYDFKDEGKLMEIIRGFSE